MPWYVFALVDAAPAGRAGKGLSAPLAIQPVGTAFAVVERRADVPPAEFGSLRRHQEVVKRLAARVPAILPVRFGTLLEREDLEEALNERDGDLAAAFDTVRNRVQFTWRCAARGARRAMRGPRSEVRGARPGSEYLRQAARAARPTPPAIWRPVRRTLATLIVAERYQAEAASAPDSLYHLVDRDAARRYATAAAVVRRDNPRLTMTGPWPPFAFAPEVL